MHRLTKPFLMNTLHFKSLLILLLITSFCTAQEVIIQVKLPEKNNPIWTSVPKPNTSIQTKIKDTVSHWTKKNQIAFNISEIAFVNWSAGGTSSISGLVKGEFYRTYEHNNHKWANELLVRYGLNKQDGIDLRKTDDAIAMNSTYGFRSEPKSNWFYSGKFNFNTQFTNGYRYGSTSNTVISKTFAPAYIFLGTGVEYATKNKNKTFYFSPFTLKTTLVLDQYLADLGSFGVTKAVKDADGNIIEHGEKIKAEFGILLNTYFKKEIAQNIIFENRLNLYTDYLNKFGNVDIDCNTKIDFIVNKYVKANLGLAILYDDDIKTKETENNVQVTKGPKTQLKQTLGIGVVYAFQ